MEVFTKRQDVKDRGKLLFTIIGINFVVFALIKYSETVDIFQWIDILSLPSDFSIFLTKPWTLITYMFVQMEFSHLFFNMLLLLIFGYICNSFLSSSQFLSLYILGGISGGIFYEIFFMSSNSQVPAFLCGASGAICGLIASASFSIFLKAHNSERKSFTRNLVCISGLLCIFIFSFFQPFSSFMSHLGGIICGITYIFFLSESKKIKSVYTEENKYKMKDLEKMIIEKARNSGYLSLTQKEKNILGKN